MIRALGSVRVMLSRAAERSSIRRRRFPRPVSESVIASCRLVSSMRRFSPNVMAVRTITARSVSAASATAASSTWLKWSYTSMATATSEKEAGRNNIRHPCRRISLRRPGAAHAAAPTSSVAAGHSASRIVPAV